MKMESCAIERLGAESMELGINKKEVKFKGANRRGSSVKCYNYKIPNAKCQNFKS